MSERITMERVRELLAVDGTRRMYGGVLMDAALVRDLAADLLDAHAALATERERTGAAAALRNEARAAGEWLRAELAATTAAAVTRADAAEAECARMRECLARANCSLEATERARYAAEEERDAVLELVADDVVRAAQERDDRDAARLAALATLRVDLADARASHAALAAAVRAERAVRAEHDAAWAAHITADDLAGTGEVRAIDARLDAAESALAALLANT